MSSDFEFDLAKSIAPRVAVVEERKVRAPQVGSGQYSSAMRALSQPEDEIFSALWLLETPDFMSGRLLDIHGSTRLQKMLDALDARIRELGLSKDLVMAYVNGVHSIEEGIAFRRLPFAERISRFRRGESQ